MPFFENNLGKWPGLFRATSMFTSIEGEVPFRFTNCQDAVAFLCPTRERSRKCVEKRWLDFVLPRESREIFFAAATWYSEAIYQECTARKGFVCPPEMPRAQLLLCTLSYIYWLWQFGGSKQTSLLWFTIVYFRIFLDVHWGTGFWPRVSPLSLTALNYHSLGPLGVDRVLSRSTVVHLQSWDAGEVENSLDSVASFEEIILGRTTPTSL